MSYALRSDGFGLAHKRAVRERFGRIVTLFGVAEQEPHAENRITLFICDGSVLAGQGAGDSPSLTIQALAWRTAEGIVRRMKSG